MCLGSFQVQLQALCRASTSILFYCPAFRVVPYSACGLEPVEDGSICIGAQKLIVPCGYLLNTIVLAQSFAAYLSLLGEPSLNSVVRFALLAAVPGSSSMHASTYLEKGNNQLSQTAFLPR